MLCQAPVEVNNFYPDYNLGQQSFQQRKEKYQSQVVQSQGEKIRQLSIENDDLKHQNMDLKMKNEELLMRLENWKDALLSDSEGKTIQVNKDTIELKVRGVKQPGFFPDYRGLTEAEKQVKMLKKELMEEREKSQSLEKTLKNYEKELARQNVELNICKSQPQQGNNNNVVMPSPLYHNFVDMDKEQHISFISQQDASQLFNQQRQEQYTEQQKNGQFQKCIDKGQKQFDQRYKLQSQYQQNKIQKYFFVNDPEVDIAKQVTNYENFYQNIDTQQKMDKLEQIHPNTIENQRDYEIMAKTQKKYYNPLYVQDMMPLPNVKTHQVPQPMVPIEGNGVIYRPVQSFDKPYSVQPQKQQLIEPQQYLDNNYSYNNNNNNQEMVKMNNFSKVLEDNQHSNRTALKNSWRIVNDVPEINDIQRKQYY